MKSYKNSSNNNTSVCVEDSSLIYVRDRHGILHPPPGYEQRNRRLTSPAKDPMLVVHGATCTFTQESPCTLYQISTNFIAKNLHLLDSLVDFPETIGYDIFHEALQTKIFHHTPEYLNTFCVAYKSLVLKHLALRQSSVVINENLQFLQCFTSLTKLDLAHCRLGDNHEYLKWIGKMKSLECICLKDNCLTDIGILSWTLPHRMFNSGPELLKTLDLSCNPKITDACAKCLVKFLHLKSLNLSGTSITLASGIQKIMKLMHLKLVSYIPDFSKDVFTKTKGWASPIIAEFYSRSSYAKPDGGKSHNQSRKCFYQAIGYSAVKVNKINECKINSDNYPTMLLQLGELVLPDSLRSIDNGSLVKQDKKRMGVDSELILHSSCKKRKLTTLEHNKNGKDKLQLTGVENLHDSTCSLLESYLKYL